MTTDAPQATDAVHSTGAADLHDQVHDHADAHEHEHEHDHDRLVREIDALSLRQALLDFEMANARVLDLTARLVEANARVVRLQTELDAFSSVSDERVASATAEIGVLRESVLAIDAAKVQAEAAAARDRAELAAIRSSRTFRTARLVKRVVGRIRS